MPLTTPVNQLIRKVPKRVSDEFSVEDNSQVVLGILASLIDSEMFLKAEISTLVLDSHLVGIQARKALNDFIARENRVISISMLQSD
jgi:hypothetical protein